MVKLQEVEDEHFNEEQTGIPFHDDKHEEDEYADTDSEISSDEEDEDDGTQDWNIKIGRAHV